MRTNVLRNVAAIVGLSACTIAQAQYSTLSNTYTSPAKWNNFNIPSNLHLAAADDDVKKEAKKAAKKKAPKKTDQEIHELPAPVPEVLPEPIADHSAAVGSQIAPAPSPYSSAASAPWGGATRPQLARYFGGANLLFLTLEDSGYRNLIVEDATGNTLVATSAVDPSATVGFEVYAGKYLDCNRYGLSLGYMYWNPSEEEILSIPAVAGDFRAAFPAWNDISIDPGTGVDTVYNHFDGAAGMRVRRDMRFQGIEANLSSFGIMGASRAASCSPPSVFSRFGSGIGLGKNRCRGYGGAAGPLVRSDCGRLQVITSHGFRWFGMKDEFELAANINGAAGYQADDLYYNVDTRNNLYGYQFGGRLVYCLNCRWNLSIGGKIGLYGNHAKYRQRIGTETALAYRNAVATDFILTEDSDTVLSTLSELDLGLGYRLSSAWTVRGGYRLMGITGVATATDQFASEYGSSLAPSTYINANDSILLHGGYVGLEYNW